MARRERTRAVIVIDHRCRRDDTRPQQTPEGELHRIGFSHEHVYEPYQRYRGQCLPEEPIGLVYLGEIAAPEHVGELGGELLQVVSQTNEEYRRRRAEAGP